MKSYQKVYRFDNGYGASVVWNPMSYGNRDGLFEIGVLDAAGNLVYDTPVTSDVVGFLDFAGVAETLEQIKNLPTFDKVSLDG